MSQEKYPPEEEYYCPQCQKRFVPAYYPIACKVCGSTSVKPLKAMVPPERDFNKDPTVLDYLKKNKQS